MKFAALLIVLCLYPASLMAQACPPQVVYQMQMQGVPPQVIAQRCGLPGFPGPQQNMQTGAPQGPRACVTQFGICPGFGPPSAYCTCNTSMGPVQGILQ